VPDCFFELSGDGYLATQHTGGPWSPEHQHAGPPTALLAREVERTVGEGWHVGRLTLEILRPIPIAVIQVSARVVRPGKRVQMFEAELSDADGVVILGRGWVIRTETVDFVDPPGRNVDITPPGPENGVEKPFFPTGQDVGYNTSMETRFLEGGYLEPGPAKAWMRMRIPLVDGEEPSPMTRVMVAADSGNGVSSPLDYTKHVFINTDLNVSLFRVPVGDWVMLDAITTPEHSGVGLSDTALYDEEGRIGRSMQTLLVRAR
jgi:hypothetical protein